MNKEGKIYVAVYYCYRDERKNDYDIYDANEFQTLEEAKNDATEAVKEPDIVFATVELWENEQFVKNLALFDEDGEHEPEH